MRCCGPDLPSHSIGMLPSMYSYSVGLAATTIRLARTSLPRKQINKNKSHREGAWVRWICSTMMHTKAQTQCSLSPARTDTQMQTDAQRRKYTEEWQRCDRPWMITSWPSGPSPQISLSGSKSGLSLYANHPSFNPTNHRPPNWQLLPITVLRLTMSSKINIEPCRRQKRSDITENRRGTGCVEY